MAVNFEEAIADSVGSQNPTPEDVNRVLETEYSCYFNPEGLNIFRVSIQSTLDRFENDLEKTASVIYQGLVSTLNSRRKYLAH